MSGRHKNWRPWVVYLESDPDESARRVVGETVHEAAENYVRDFTEPFKDQTILHVCPIDEAGQKRNTVDRVWVDWYPRVLTKTRLPLAELAQGDKTEEA